MSGDKDCAALNEIPYRFVPGITQGDIAQLDIAGILNPSVAEDVVADTVIVSDARHVCVLSFHQPSAVDRRSLVGEIHRGLRDSSDCIVGIIAESIGESEIEREITIFESCEERAKEVGCR